MCNKLTHVKTLITKFQRLNNRKITFWKKVVPKKRGSTQHDHHDEFKIQK